MKRLLSLITAALLVTPVYAQDDFGGASLSQSDIDSLLGGGGRGGRGGGQRGGNNVQSILPDPVVMYNQIRDLLKNKKTPLAKDQEKQLQTLLNDETKAIRTALEQEYPQLNPNNQQQQNQQNQQNRGNQQNNPQNTQTARIDAVVLKENTALLTQIKADLTPEQVALLDKAEKDKKCVVLLDGHYSFLQNGQRGNGTGQNNRQWCTFGDMTPTQRVAPIRDILKKGNKALTDAQDKKIVSLVEAKLPDLERELRTEGVLNNNNQNRGNQNNNQNNQNNQYQQISNNIVNQIFQSMGIANNNNNNQQQQQQRFEEMLTRACAPGANTEQIAQEFFAQQQQQQGQAQGNRGFPGNFGNQNIEQMCQQRANQANRGGRGGQVNFNVIQLEIQKRNEVLLDKIVAMMNKDQQAVVKRFKYDQIKSRGGSERIRGILEEEGTPLTEQQTTQVAGFFNQSNQELRQWANTFVLQQVTATPPPAQQPQNNQNRGNQPGQPNPQQQYIQQMTQQLLPKVAAQRAAMDNATMNSVMKVLTPSQVASYKINMSMPPLY